MASVLFTAIHEAGWPVFPILGVGLSALVLALGYVRRPLESTAGLIRNLSVVTLLLGVLGTAVGLQHSILYIDGLPVDQRWIVWTGLRETLNNLNFALVLMVPTWLLYAAGSFRSRQLKEAGQAEQDG